MKRDIGFPSCELDPQDWAWRDVFARFRFEHECARDAISAHFGTYTETGTRLLPGERFSQCCGFEIAKNLATASEALWFLVSKLIAANPELLA